jgi:hypothetical protein
MHSLADAVVPLVAALDVRVRDPGQGVASHEQRSGGAVAPLELVLARRLL